jgi:hypothetical protein
MIGADAEIGPLRSIKIPFCEVNMIRHSLKRASRMIGVVIVYLSIVAVLGCNEKAGSKGGSGNGTTESSGKVGTDGSVVKGTNDPVESLKTILASVEKDVAAENLAHITSDSGSEDRGWVKRAIVLSDMKYDVKKTDSLVSPYTAPVSFKLSTIQSEVFATKTAAEKAAIKPAPSESWLSCRADFVFQDNRWVAKSGEWSYLFYQTPSWAPFPKGPPYYLPQYVVWKAIEDATAK